MCTVFTQVHFNDPKHHNYAIPKKTRQEKFKKSRQSQLFYLVKAVNNNFK